MKKVRKGIFETNSSSSHSIHIDDDMGLMDTSMVPDEDGKIYITESEFGWEWDKLTTAQEKADYCYTDQRNIEMLEKVIKDQTGAKEVIFSGNGYVDSQSGGTSYLAHKDEDTLRNLIFNTRSTIYTGNDNGEPPLYFYCDSHIGKHKITLIDSVILRDKNINSLLDEKDGFDEENLNWTYSFGTKEQQITDAVYEFLQHFQDGYAYTHNNDYYIRENIDINKMVVSIEKHNHKEKKTYDKQELTILIRDN
tara:strand:- start:81568 stop:82320 length:753 start_codon:yes stop_codon:yes gene_type:complete